jgi:NadR type nicotinamide-nucleotide adenylyltransferase
MSNLIKIAITGPESTGKSALAESLAARYQTLWVPEFARTYIENLDRPYRFEDLVEIARGQMALEIKAAAEAGKLLFCDTDLLVIKIWSEHAFGKVDPWILDQLAQRRYDLYILTNIDMPWEPDPQREHPNLRDFFMEWYKAELEKMSIPYAIISGSGEERLKNAIAVVDEVLKV